MLLYLPFRCLTINASMQLAGTGSNPFTLHLNPQNLHEMAHANGSGVCVGIRDLRNRAPLAPSPDRVERELVNAARQILNTVQGFDSGPQHVQENCSKQVNLRAHSAEN